MADDKTDQWHDKVLGMADDLGLEGEERDDYIHDHMTAKGYKVVRSYVPGEDDDASRGKSQRRRFSTGGGNRGGQRRRDNDDDW